MTKYFTKRERYLLYAVGAASALVIILVALLAYSKNSVFAHYLFGIAVAVAILPETVFFELEHRWVTGIENKIPDLLEDIGEGQLAGMTFVRALEGSANKNFGPLTDELRRVLNKIRVGGTVEEAFEILANRVDSKLVRMATTIIIETNRAGGDIDRIVRSMAGYFWDVKAMSIERNSSMKIYVYITYISFAILLVTIDVILNQLLFPLIVTGGSTPLFVPQASFETYRIILYDMTLFLAIASGLVAGKMGEGTIRAGLKHIIVMLVITIVIFGVLVVA
jgi:flagellar protein FlaJ